MNTITSFLHEFTNLTTDQLNALVALGAIGVAGFAIYAVMAIARKR